MFEPSAEFSFSTRLDGPPLIKVCLIIKFTNDMTMMLKIKVPKEFYEKMSKSNEEDPIHSFDFTFGPLRVATAHRTIESFEILREN